MTPEPSNAVGVANGGDLRLADADLSGGAGTMTVLERKSFEAPDEVRTPYEKGRVDVVNTAEWPVKRVNLEPGWRWTEHTRPVVGTDLARSFTSSSFCTAGSVCA